MVFQFNKIYFFLIFFLFFQSDYLFSGGSRVGEVTTLPKTNSRIFYHWGKKEHLEQMIREKTPTTERWDFFNQTAGRVYGAGIYLADTPFGSGEFGNADDYMLMEVRVAKGFPALPVRPDVGWYVGKSEYGLSFTHLSATQMSQEDFDIIMGKLNRNSHHKSMAHFKASYEQALLYQPFQAYLQSKFTSIASDEDFISFFDIEKDEYFQGDFANLDKERLQSMIKDQFIQFLESQSDDQISEKMMLIDKIMQKMKIIHLSVERVKSKTVKSMIEQNVKRATSELELFEALDSENKVLLELDSEENVKKNMRIVFGHPTINPLIVEKIKKITEGQNPLSVEV
jgi:hypothetical protein